MSNPIIGGHVSSSGGIFSSVERGENIEAEAIQIFCSAPQMWRATKHTDDAIEKYREAFKKSKLSSAWIHNIYLANLATDDKAMLEKSKNSIKNSLTVADQIGATGVVLHTGSHKGRGFDAVSSQIVDSLQEILGDTPKSPVLALENMAGQGGVIGAALSDLGKLIKGVKSKRMAVCLDTCHAFAAGYDIRDTNGVDDLFEEFEAEIGLDRLAVVHANDSLMDLGSNRDRHENIGQGFIGDDGFRALLAHEASAGIPFLLEVPGYPLEGGGKGDGPDIRNIRHLKSLRDG